MKLEDLHRLVSFELRRGTVLDAYIPLWVKQGVQMLERNTAMKYMEEWVNIRLQPGDQTIDFVWAFRNWRFLRYAAGAEWYYLKKQDPRNEKVNSAGPGSVVVYPQNDPMLTPAKYNQPQQYSMTRFSQIGMRYIRFNTPWGGPSDVLLEGIVYKYSDWQTTKPDFRHYLLDQASDLVLFASMVRIAAAIKDTRLRDQYGPMRDEALKTLLNADQDAEYGEAQEDFIEYGGNLQVTHPAKIGIQLPAVDKWYDGVSKDQKLAIVEDHIHVVPLAFTVLALIPSGRYLQVLLKGR